MRALALAALVVSSLGSCALHPGRVYPTERTVTDAPRRRTIATPLEDAARDEPPPTLQWREQDDRKRAQIRTLKNGARLVLLPRDDSSAATIVFVVGLGRPVPAAIARMYGAMALHPIRELAWETERADGARRRLYVWGDGVALEVTGLSQILPRTLERLLPAFIAPPINGSSIDIGRQIVEGRTPVNEPQRRARSSLYRQLFGAEHPYGTPSDDLSYRELRRVDAPMLKEFVRSHIAADNVTAVATGAGLPAIVDVVERALNELAPRAEPRPPVPPPRSCTTHRLVANRDSLVVFGYRTVPASHADAPALEVLAAAAGGGLSSRFNRTLRHGLQVTYGVHVESSALRDGGIFEVITRISASNTDAALAALDAEVARLTESELDAAELLSAKIAAAHARTFPTPAVALARATVEGRRSLEEVHAVSASDVRRVAQRYLDVSRRCVVE